MKKPFFVTFISFTPRYERATLHDLTKWSQPVDNPSSKWSSILSLPGFDSFFCVNSHVHRYLSIRYLLWWHHWCPFPSVWVYQPPISVFAIFDHYLHFFQRKLFLSLNELEWPPDGNTSWQQNLSELCRLLVEALVSLWGMGCSIKSITSGPCWLSIHQNANNSVKCPSWFSGTSGELTLIILTTLSCAQHWLALHAPRPEVMQVYVVFVYVAVAAGLWNSP